MNFLSSIVIAESGFFENICLPPIILIVIIFIIIAIFKQIKKSKDKERMRIQYNKEKERRRIQRIKMAEIERIKEEKRKEEEKERKILYMKISECFTEKLLETEDTDFRLSDNESPYAVIYPITSMHFVRNAFQEDNLYDTMIITDKNFIFKGNNILKINFKNISEINTFDSDIITSDAIKITYQSRSNYHDICFYWFSVWDELTSEFRNSLTHILERKNIGKVKVLKHFIKYYG